jgi:hypothetical protein
MNAYNTVAVLLAPAKRPAGFTRHATGGIRGRVVAMLGSVPAGAWVAVDSRESTLHPIVPADLVAAWGGNGTAAKVCECMSILAGSGGDYGYAVEGRRDPTRKLFTAFRLVPGTPGAPAVDGTVHAAAPADASPAPAVTITPAAPAAPEPAAEPAAPADAIDVFVDAAIASGEPKTWIKDNVPGSDRGAVRKRLAERSAQ